MEWKEVAWGGGVLHLKVTSIEGLGKTARNLSGKFVPSETSAGRNLENRYHLIQRCSVRKKGKGRLWVLQHCCLEAYCILTRMSSFIHLQRRCTHQAA